MRFAGLFGGGGVFPSVLAGLVKDITLLENGKEKL